MARTKSKKISLQKSFLSFSRKNLAIFAVVFAVIGSVFLYQTFAAQQYINYYGSLDSSNPSAEYSLTTGEGIMQVSFSNNTSDVKLSIKDSSGLTIGRLNSRGKKDVTLKTNVFADTYTLSLTSDKSFKSRKGYSVKINYPEVEPKGEETPEGDTTKPSAIIVNPLKEERVSGTSEVSVEAQDNIGVTQVEIFVNDTLIKSDNEMPWYTRWDSRNFDDGTATITVKAYDASGNIAQASGTIVIDNEEDPIETGEQRFPGDPNPLVNHKSYWGAGIEGNGDPARHEDPTGKSLSVRRTFYQWSHAASLSSSLYRRVQDDHANNRLPYISIKTPGWNAVANGQYDKELDAMLRELDSYGKPVWLTVHHEPEGGGTFGNSPDDPGGPAAWRDMQKQVRRRINAVGTKNIAFMPTVMTYTWNPASKRNPNDWWVEGIWDAYCVDHYAHTESAELLDTGWFDFVDWIEERGLPYCIGEWGNRGTNAEAGRKIQEFWDWSFKNNKDLIGYSYFDSSLNSPGGSWSLEGERYRVFQDILKNDDRVQRINDL